MKRKLIFLVWLLVPVLLLAYHYGPGQLTLARDKAATFAREAGQLEKAEDWAGAVDAYQRALAALPPEDQNGRFKLRLAAANARMYIGELPEALQDLDNLLSEMRKVNAPAPAVHDVRSALAGAQYYAAWLMRLENAPTEEWMEQAENSRQNFRLLAEETQRVTRRRGGLCQEPRGRDSVGAYGSFRVTGIAAPEECQGCKTAARNAGVKKKAVRRSPRKSPKMPVVPESANVLMAAAPDRQIPFKPMKPPRNPFVVRTPSILIALSMFLPAAAPAQVVVVPAVPSASTLHVIEGQTIMVEALGDPGMPLPPGAAMAGRGNTNRAPADKQLQELLQLQFDRRPQEVLQTMSRQLDGSVEQTNQVQRFRDDVVAGRWSAVGEFISKLPEAQRAQVYRHVLTGLQRTGGPGMPGQPVDLEDPADPEDPCLCPRCRLALL
jgi:hypothetical protein